ncbi:MAG: hypothetical protein GHCLOJNM_02440 [bacterium]|nr:hypothetical protein [bacterium]
MLASVIQLRFQQDSRHGVREDAFRERPSEEFLTRLEDILVLGSRTTRSSGADVLTPDFPRGLVRSPHATLREE